MRSFFHHSAQPFVNMNFVCFVCLSVWAAWKNGVRPNSNSVGPFLWCFMHVWCPMFLFHRSILNRRATATTTLYIFQITQRRIEPYRHTRTHRYRFNNLFFIADPVYKTEQKLTYHSAWLASGFVCASMYSCVYLNVWTCFKDEIEKQESTRERENK